MTEPTFQGFTATALASLAVDGTAERWGAVQEQLHPALLALAEQLDTAGRARFSREWPLYEVTWKAARYRNRGRGRREPISEYHFALDRPPRGSGIYVGVSGEERTVLVGLTLWGARKEALRRVWESSRPIWQPLVEAIPEARFSAARHAGQSWLDAYLRSDAQYLWVGYVYHWDDPYIAAPGFGATLVEDALRLIPLNEAIMEEVETLEWDGDGLIREAAGEYSAAPQVPSFDTLAERIAASGFAYDDEVLRAYHVALQTKPFVILPGISGTGKTRLTRLYADAVHNVPSAAPRNPFYLLVAVQPDWHNARDLLGYYNGLTGLFHPTALLRFLHRAASDPQQLYYVCLDELNLARPEYYLAPILSALETAEHLLDLGAPGATVSTADGLTLRNPFRLPLNVAFTGTVNVDESTFALSDRLLDRANVIELTKVDLAAFRRTYNRPIDEAAWTVLVRLHAILAEIDQPFGYRTAAEALRYLERARDVLPSERALDLQIKQKILPKVRGEDEPPLRHALEALLSILGPQPGSAEDRFPESAEKVRRMRQRLEREGYTDFYG
jgi:MoxR-like ATPase